MEHIKKCCCLCQFDCNWPWMKKKEMASEAEVEVDYHFRGRINSTNSIGQTESPIPIQIVTEQPQPESLESERPKKHKKSISSLDSAIISSASGILNQVLLERNKRSDGPHAMISFVCDNSFQRMSITLISIKNYNSMFLLKSASSLSRNSSENVSLLNPTPSLMVRISLDPDGDQVGFTSVHSRSKHPVWKEQLNFDLDVKQREQNIILILYESNRFSRWTPVKMASHCLKDVTMSSNQNLSFGLESLNADIQVYGEIKLSFCYNKASNRIFCDILEIRSLLHFGLNKRTEYFIKIQFFEKKKLLKVKKTSAGKPETSSVLQINETVSAKVPVAALNNLNVKISVCDAKLIIGDSSLYYLNFGQDSGSGPRESTYWSDFIREIPASGKKQWFSLLQK